MLASENSSPVDPAPSRDSSSRRKKRRYLKDVLARYTVGIGGVSVIFAIVLIFFYLLYVVYPLFIPASMERQADYRLPAAQAGRSLYLSMEEQNKVGLRVTDKGNLVFFAIDDGHEIKQLKLPSAKAVSSFAADRPSTGNLVFGFADGTAIVMRHKYLITYPGDEKHVEPEVEYPLGNKPILIDKKRRPLTSIAFASGEDRSTIVASTADERLLLVTLAKEESGLSLGGEDSTEFKLVTTPLPAITGVQKILVDPNQDTAYIVEQSGNVTSFNIRDPEAPLINERVPLSNDKAAVSSIEFLTGGISLLVGDADGSISQWFPVTTNGRTSLTKIREFDADRQQITGLVTEQRRKGFIAVDKSGSVGIYHSTARRTLMREKLSGEEIEFVAVSPRANRLMIQDKANKIGVWTLENEHPEISWGVLWDKVWYESYNEPGYTWQSSSASNDFEPKFSLMPLAFGTLKGAFYAMLFAVPLAIFGAIYTAYFMAPAMRAYVKPTIEIMEALPTVILGFLAGLWLAPFVENKLPAIFSLLLLMPLGTLGVSYLWSRLPKRYTSMIPDGWQAALLIPVLIIIGAISISLSGTMESVFFGGDIKHWLSTELGLTYDQRNSVVVGIAMGVAVIPTIFSIAEDAIFSVPKHLTFGSLALGATFWQTLTRVVILTASPGIFSAVMIGLGRAVGETMIVLMATGNTPVMDLSIFQGMRTLSANIAVEMPEAELDSTHYRILFLAALVLFLFTFLFNTAAEIVRQRLREKYSSL